jgi:N-methylhydantoinase B
MVASQIDPMTLSVIHNRLVHITREMAQVIMRCSQNYPSSQLFDFSTGLFDPEGELLAHGASLPSNAFTGRGQVREVIARFGDRIYPGDEFILNDPYVGAGTHLPCWGFVSPIFYKDELLYFAHTKQHQMDTSGSFPGGYFPDAYDIHAEGLCMPPIKFTERGQPNEGVRDFLYNNVRYREDVKIDNQSQFAAHRIAAERMARMLDRYGKETLQTYVKAMLDRMERFVRSEIQKIPDGTYYGEAACDDDGTKHGVVVWVRAKVTVKGDEVTVDLRDSDKQVAFINSPLENTLARVYTSIFYCLDPSMSRYHNEGSCRPIHIITAPGTVVHPVYPATVGACPIFTGSQIRDAILQALGQADPTRVTSGWSKQMGFDDWGLDRRGVPFWTAQFFHGGGGAAQGADGWPYAMIAGLRKGVTEVIESRYPWQVLCVEMTKDTEGAGQWRGGPGTHVEWVSQSKGRHQLVTGNSDGCWTETYALAGGQLPSPKYNVAYIIRKNGERETVPTKRGPYELQEGDRWVVYSAGGSGWGNPKERDPELVRKDVLNELVSLERARDVYGVAINPDTLEIDQEETRRLRSS